MPCTVERLGVGREPTPAILAFLSEPPEVVSFWISFFPVLLFKVFSRFLFFGKVGSICHDIVNLQTFLLLYLVRYASILSKIYPLVITMVTHANGLQTRALVDQVYTGIKKMFSLLHKYIFDGSRNRKLGFLKTDFFCFGVHPLSVSHHWPPNDLGAEVGQQPRGWESANSVPQWYPATLSYDKWERGRFNWHNNKKRNGLKSPSSEIDTHWSYRMNAKLRGFITLNQLSWDELSLASRGIWLTTQRWYTVRYQSCSFFSGGSW